MCKSLQNHHARMSEAMCPYSLEFLLFFYRIGVKKLPWDLCDVLQRRKFWPSSYNGMNYTKHARRQRCVSAYGHAGANINGRLPPLSIGERSDIKPSAHGVTTWHWPHYSVNSSPSGSAQNIGVVVPSKQFLLRLRQVVRCPNAFSWKAFRCRNSQSMQWSRRAPKIPEAK